MAKCVLHTTILQADSLNQPKTTISFHAVGIEVKKRDHHCRFIVAVLGPEIAPSLQSIHQGGFLHS